ASSLHLDFSHEFYRLNHLARANAPLRAVRIVVRYNTSASFVCGLGPHALKRGNCFLDCSDLATSPPNLYRASRGIQQPISPTNFSTKLHELKPFAPHLCEGIG